MRRVASKRRLWCEKTSGRTPSTPLQIGQGFIKKIIKSSETFLDIGDMTTNIVNIHHFRTSLLSVGNNSVLIWNGFRTKDDKNAPLCKESKQCRLKYEILTSETYLVVEKVDLIHGSLPPWKRKLMHLYRKYIPPIWVNLNLLYRESPCFREIGLRICIGNVPHLFEQTSHLSLRELSPFRQNEVTHMYPRIFTPFATLQIYHQA